MTESGSFFGVCMAALNSDENLFLEFVGDSLIKLLGHSKRYNSRNDIFAPADLFPDPYHKKIIETLNDTKWTVIRAGPGAGKSFLCSQFLQNLSGSFLSEDPVVYHLTETRTSLASVGDGLAHASVKVISKTFASFKIHAEKLLKKQAVLNNLKKLDDIRLTNIVDNFLDTLPHYSNNNSADSEDDLAPETVFGDGSGNLSPGIIRDNPCLLFVDEAQLMDVETLFYVVMMSLLEDCVHVFVTYDVLQSASRCLIEHLLTTHKFTSQLQIASKSLSSIHSTLGRYSLPDRHVFSAFLSIQDKLFNFQIHHSIACIDLLITMRQVARLYDEVISDLGPSARNQFPLIDAPHSRLIKTFETPEDWYLLSDIAPGNSDHTQLIVLVDNKYSNILSFYQQTHMSAAFFNFTANTNHKSPYKRRLMINMGARAHRAWLSVFSFVQELKVVIDDYLLPTGGSNNIDILAVLFGSSYCELMDDNGAILSTSQTKLRSAISSVKLAVVEIMSGYGHDIETPSAIPNPDYTRGLITYDNLNDVNGMTELMFLFTELFSYIYKPIENYDSKLWSIINSNIHSDENHQENIQPLVRLVGRLWNIDFISSFYIVNVFHQLSRLEGIIRAKWKPGHCEQYLNIFECSLRELKGMLKNISDSELYRYDPSCQYVIISHHIPQTLHGATYDSILYNKYSINSDTGHSVSHLLTVSRAKTFIAEYSYIPPKNLTSSDQFLSFVRSTLTRRFKRTEILTRALLVLLSVKWSMRAHLYSKINTSTGGYEYIPTIRSCAARSQFSHIVKSYKVHNESNTSNLYDAPSQVVDFISPRTKLHRIYHQPSSLNIFRVPLELRGWIDCLCEIPTLGLGFKEEYWPCDEFFTAVADPKNYTTVRNPIILSSYLNYVLNRDITPEEHRRYAENVEKCYLWSHDTPCKLRKQDTNNKSYNMSLFDMLK